MKSKKRLSILLALSLLCSFCALAVSAEDAAVIGTALVRMEDTVERPNAADPASDDNRANMKYPEPLGTIFSTTPVEIHTGDTVADVVENFIASKGGTTTHWGTTKDSYYLTGVTVTDEQGRALEMGEYDAGSKSGWAVKYNNWFTTQGAHAYDAEDGDVVEILYSCAWNADLGNNGPDCKITGLSICSDAKLESRSGIKVGTLSPAFSSSVKEYTLTLPADVKTIRASVTQNSYSADTTYTLIDGETQTVYKYFRDIPVKDGADLKIETEYHRYFDNDWNPIDPPFEDADAITIHLAVKKDDAKPSFLQTLRNFFQRILNYLKLALSILKLR